MERKIGEIFQDENVTLKVKKAKGTFSCLGCYWENELEPRDKCHSQACLPSYRTDKKSVIFAKQ